MSSKSNFSRLSENQKKAWFKKKGIKYLSKEEYKLQKEHEAMMNEMVKIATKKSNVIKEEVDDENEAFMREIKEEIERKNRLKNTKGSVYWL